MKKKLTVLISIILILALIILPFIYFSYVTKWKYKVEEFELYKKDFEIIAELTENHFENSDETNTLISVGYDKNTKNYELWYDGARLQLTNAQHKSLKRLVEQAFPRDLDSNFDRITYYDEYVSFGIDNGQYAVVYSSDNIKPDFLIKPDENVDFSVKKIEKYWYHVVCNS